MNYLNQVQRGIDYVEEHLHEPITLADVSRAAGVSHWHFLRMFKALTKETLKSYIRSRRLAEARVELLTSADSVLAIALRAGFESQASFTRAFRAAFGMPPAEYRARENEHVHFQKLRIDEGYIRHVGGGVSLEPTIAACAERHMVGLATRIYDSGSERNNMGEILPRLWNDFLPRMDEIHDAVPGTCYGIIRQAEPEHELLEYSAAMEVARVPQSLPSGMTHWVVPAAAYATFTHRGKPKEIDQTVNYVYSSWLVRSGRRHTYGPDIEVYDHRWRQDSPDSIMEYAIPLND